MPPSVVHLPNGHDVTVTPVFGGLSFKASDLNRHPTPFPPGWTIIIHSEDDDASHLNPSAPSDSPDDDLGPQKKRHTHRFVEPTLRNDHLFISSISNPSSSDFKPAISPTRQIAMMLWTTLWWYFHQPEPHVQPETPASAKTAPAGRPKADWKVTINREGIFKGKHLLQKLERMGLIINEDSSVGVDTSREGIAAAWSQTYVTRRHFWQLDARIFLFTLSPTLNSPFPSASPSTSRPASPNRAGILKADSGPMTPPFGAQQATWSSTDPFHSTSHLPTFFPPAPATYVWTGNTRHPKRPRAPRQGEIFYTRYIPSLGETLSFRVPSLSSKALPHSPALPGGLGLRAVSGMSDTAVPTLSTASDGASDVELLHRWMNDPRVAHSWGEDGPIEHQQKFLEGGLQLKHSFPVIGCFDGKPFAYFEIYWVREDRLGAHLGGSVGDFDRGFHCLVGEQDFRGSHRVKVWLSALVHYCLLADQRTNAVMLEPRVDNEKLRRYCEDVGFFKEREISFPHKQSNLMKIQRESWEAPCL